MNASPIGRVLGGSDALTRLRDHAARLVRMQRTIDQVLPRANRGRVAVANLQDGELALHVSSAALAARLKLSVPTLLMNLQNAGEPVTGIRIRVRARGEMAEPPADAVSPRSIGQGGKQSLKALQSSLKEDSALARALGEMIAKSR
ncbi:DciA family protein [Uliginosibacterium sp. H1]|uniref:DciA family protein n=1 Tax=Uliginosibacterium sp. H1 TaxID=3114757 RepID=UPI002E186404|nr:DciA family protein [Uliginosibacterium sp. H1]